MNPDVIAKNMKSLLIRTNWRKPPVAQGPIHAGLYGVIFVVIGSVYEKASKTSGAISYEDVERFTPIDISLRWCAASMWEVSTIDGPGDGPGGGGYAYGGWIGGAAETGSATVIGVLAAACCGMGDTL